MGDQLRSVDASRQGVEELVLTALILAEVSRIRQAVQLCPGALIGPDEGQDRMAAVAGDRVLSQLDPPRAWLRLRQVVGAELRRVLLVGVSGWRYACCPPTRVGPARP